MRKIIVEIFFLLLSIELCAQYPTYQSTSYDDYMAPLREYQNAFNRADNKINTLQITISEALANDIDEELRSDLNEDYRILSAISKKLYSIGIYPRIWNELNTIQTSIHNHINEYNDRVANRKRRQTEVKRQEEIAKRENVRKEWTGTGFALSNGYVVTNYHVVDSAQTIVIKGVKGDFTTAFYAEVAAVDKTNDLAILKIKDENFRGLGTIPYRIKSSMSEVGTYVWTLGYPMTAVMGDEIKYTDGKINSKSGYQGDVSVYQISIPIQPGNSGSPIFDRNGYVVGVASSGLNRRVFNSENVNYAIKSNYLRMLIESTLSSNILPNGTALQGVSNTEQIKIAQNYVYLIQCSNGSSISNLSTSQSERIIERPSMRSSPSSTAVIRIILTETSTAIEIAYVNPYDIEGWCSINPHTYILDDNYKSYTMIKADGIKMAPEKTSFGHKGQTLCFTLYFPAIPQSTTRIDLIEPNSSWKWYGIELSK